MPGGPALFTPVGDRYEPGELTRGPWRPDAQHGGPPAALLAHLTEPHVGADQFVAHIEVELVRPVPLSLLSGRVSAERVSGRVQRVRAELFAGEQLVARSTALVLACSDIPPPDWSPNVEPVVDPPDEDRAVDPPRWAAGDRTAYHRNAVEHRIVDGSFGEPGPAVDWIRLRQPVVAGFAPSGLQRVLAAADFGSGVSAVYHPTSTTGLINANLTVAFLRGPVGEWVCVDSRTDVGDDGVGLCVSRIGDVRGRVGVATQSLLGYSMKP